MKKILASSILAAMFATPLVASAGEPSASPDQKPAASHKDKAKEKAKAKTTKSKAKAKAKSGSQTPSDSSKVKTGEKDKKPAEPAK